MRKAANILCGSRLMRRWCSTQQVPPTAMPPVPGSATPEATRSFVAKSRLPLFHSFSKSNLVVNPTIVGPPKGKDSDDPEANSAIRRCILVNGANCVVVSSYQPLKDGKMSMWFTSEVARMVAENEVKREELVLMVDLGKIDTEEEIGERLALSMHMCCLEEIDAVMIKIDQRLFGDPRQLNIVDILQTLETFTGNEHLKFYGLHIDVPPYSYHTPPVRSISNQGYIPAELEETMHYDLEYADFVSYQISPTTAIPATLPMLEPDEYDGSISPAAYVNEKGRGIVTEKSRKFTRMALDPLLCFSGRAPLDNNQGDGVFLSKGDIDKLKQKIESINSSSEKSPKEDTKGEGYAIPNTDMSDDLSKIPNGYASV